MLIGQPGFEPGTPSPPDLYAKPTALLPDQDIRNLSLRHNISFLADNVNTRDKYNLPCYN